MRVDEACDVPGMTGIGDMPESGTSLRTMSVIGNYPIGGGARQAAASSAAARAYAQARRVRTRGRGCARHIARAGARVGPHDDLRYFFVAKFDAREPRSLFVMSPVSS